MIIQKKGTAIAYFKEYYELWVLGNVPSVVDTKNYVWV